MVSFTVKSLFYLFFLLTLAGCGNESAQDVPQSSATNGFVPNPNGFSFANYGDIKNDDLSDENIATLYGSENVCYNKDGSNCLLSAMGNFYKKIQIDGQKGGQCYGFAVATAMLYNGGYAYNGKYSPSDFNPEAQTAYDLNKSDVANFIAMKFTNQSTPEIQEVAQQCSVSTTRVQFDKIEESLSTNDPVAVLAFFDINGNNGHAVTPYKVERSGAKAKIFVYDNNFPGNSELYFDVDLDTQAWVYSEGRTNVEAEQSILYKGQGEENPFCAIALSETQAVSLPSEDDKEDDMVRFELLGDAQEVRYVIYNSQEEGVGYDFDTQSKLMEIEGALEVKRLDGMPSLYKIPVPQKSSVDSANIATAEDIAEYFKELLFVHVEALPQKTDESAVALSMSAKTQQYHSGLMFDNISIDANGTMDVAFHPGGRFLLFENTNIDGIAPIIRMYFDDFEKEEGAVHSITLGNVPSGLMIGAMIESVDTVNIFAYDEKNNERHDLIEGDSYEIASLYVDKNGTTIKANMFDDGMEDTSSDHILGYMGFSTANPRFTRASDIVTDKSTGLMWQDDEAAKTVRKPWLTIDNYTICHENRHNLTYLLTCLNTKGDTAVTYCSELSLGGYTDWRLPFEQELLKIADPNIKPVIGIYFKNIAPYNGYGYWSRNSFSYYEHLARYVNFDYGYAANSEKDSEEFVRCVRKQ